jgi:hypothetical protein
MEEFNILLEVVLEVYGLSFEELTVKTRKRDYVELRYACFNLMLKYSNLDLEDITPLLKIDRTTGYNALKVNENSMSNKSNGSYIEKYNALEEEFVNKLQTPERLIAKIESLKKEKSILEDNIKNLKKLLDSKLSHVEV